MYQIRPWLFVGRYADTRNLDLLEAHDIGAMLQLAESVKQDGINSLYVAVEDGEPLPPGSLKRGVTFVRAEKAQGHNVLVACGAGISRSSTFAIAALKEEENLDLLEAFRQLCMKHPTAMPHPELWTSLCEYSCATISLHTMMDTLREVRRNY
jgi:protein-tyrosine phosphatase